MSDKISYILEVLDSYSKPLKDFKIKIDAANKATEKSIALEKKLGQQRSFSFSNQKQKIALEEKYIRLKKQSAVNDLAAARSTKLALDLDLQNYRRQQQLLNFNRSVVRRGGFAGAFTPIRFNPQMGKYEPSIKPSLQPLQEDSSSGISFKNVAKAIGYYTLIDKAIAAPKKIYEVTKDMDSLRASLSALIPNVKGLEGSSAEGEINYLRGVSNKYGIRFQDIAPNYMKLLGSGNADASLAKGLIENVGGYGRLVGLKPDAINDTMLGFQQMLDKQKIQGQEFNLQMQQLVGAKPLFYEAFRRVAQRSGINEVTKENSSVWFAKYMEAGMLPSNLILREFVEVLKEGFGEKMLEKAKTLGAEEARLATATQTLADKLGLLAYPAQIGAIRGLTAVVDGISNLTNATSNFSEKAAAKAEQDKKMYEPYKRSLGNDIGSITKPWGWFGEGIEEIAKAPVKLSNYAWEAVKGTGEGLVTGDWSTVNKANKDLVDYYFPGLNQQFDKLVEAYNAKPQKIIIEFQGNVPPNTFAWSADGGQNMPMPKDSTLTPIGGY